MYLEYRMPNGHPVLPWAVPILKPGVINSKMLPTMEQWHHHQATKKSPPFHRKINQVNEVGCQLRSSFHDNMKAQHHTAKNLEASVTESLLQTLVFKSQKKTFQRGKTLSSNLLTTSIFQNVAVI